MDRFRKSDGGWSLAEMIIAAAMVIATVMVIAAVMVIAGASAV